MVDINHISWKNIYANTKWKQCLGKTGQQKKLRHEYTQVYDNFRWHLSN